MKAQIFKEGFTKAEQQRLIRKATVFYKLLIFKMIMEYGEISYGEALEVLYKSGHC